AHFLHPVFSGSARTRMLRCQGIIVASAILIAIAARSALADDDLLREIDSSSPADQSLLTECADSKSSFVWPRTWQLGPNWTAQLRGRVDTDAIWSSQSPANEATFGDLGDVVGLRRARIGAEGEICSGRYVWEIDMAPGVVVPRDIYFACGER